MGVAQEIGLAIPDMVTTDETLAVTAISATGNDRLALRYTVREADGTAVRTGLLSNAGSGRYVASIPPLRVVVKEVEGLVLVWGGR
jgi:hypothetical protein